MIDNNGDTGGDQHAADEWTKKERKKIEGGAISTTK
jgi:hypothetical protein